MLLEVTKTRSGGYLHSGAPNRIVSLDLIEDATAVERGSCCSCLGRSFTIILNMRDQTQMQLTPLADLTQQRAYEEAKKITNAVRLSRGEALLL